MMWQQEAGLFLSVKAQDRGAVLPNVRQVAMESEETCLQITHRGIGSERDKLAGMRPATARFLFFFSLLPISPLSLGLTTIMAYCRESFKENRAGKRKKDKT